MSQDDESGGDWAEGHDMEGLPPDPFTAQRYFICGNCGASGHITPTGITSGEASYQPCTNPKVK